MKLKVGVLYGGKSAEHDVSIKSAKNIVNAMDRNKYDIHLIKISKDGTWYWQKKIQSFLLKERLKTILKYYQIKI
jgi:D-alanine-D-alanine ligase